MAVKRFTTVLASDFDAAIQKLSFLRKKLAAEQMRTVLAENNLLQKNREVAHLREQLALSERRVRQLYDEDPSLRDIPLIDSPVAA